MTTPDVSTADEVVATDAVRRAVGRPRQHDHDVERGLIIDAAYVALREHGADLTIANILDTAGVYTRSFYRHFESKDALLCAMYRRDAEWAAERVSKRLLVAPSPAAAVELWVDEIFDFTRSARRAERVSVLGSINANRADGAEHEAAHARTLLVAPLRAAIEAGIGAGDFADVDAATGADLIAVAVMHAAGLSAGAGQADQVEVTAFCLRALGWAAAR